MADTDDVLKALTTRFGFEVLQPTVGPNQIRALGRVQQQHQDNWVVGIQHILTIAEGAGWSVDISRQYFLRAGLVVYAWRVIFQGEDIAQHVAHILATMANAPRARVQVQEQRLSVTQGQRNMMSPGGKGASSAGTVPMIHQRSGMRG